jgi:hypothetical protein
MDRWHFISHGTPVIPYEWFLALEQPGETAPTRQQFALYRGIVQGNKAVLRGQ